MAGKRAFDVCFALCVLILLAPLSVVIALWIKLDSRGPVLFRQQRVGWRGRPFMILKFRTMRADMEADGPQITVGADARITRAGAFLRRCKLDELPQFVNVLRGEMSVVGPRPEVARYVALYPPELREAVLSVRPGITDPASVLYRDEAAVLGHAEDPETFYVEVIVPAKLECAVRYVRTRSLWGDVMIVLRTATVLFGRQRR